MVSLLLTNGEISEAFFALARVITTHVTRGVEPRVDALGSNMNSMLGDYVRMNPIFFGSKVRDNPQEFLDIVYKVLTALGVTSMEKAE